MTFYDMIKKQSLWIEFLFTFLHNNKQGLELSENSLTWSQTFIIDWESKLFLSKKNVSTLAANFR